MAINVDTVYKTVLLILNKEQRGYITPDEFNKIATQVQLDIFEQYFDDLNQQLRVPQADYDYSDRQMSIDEKISPFKTEGICIYSAGKFNLPVLDIDGNTVLYGGAEPSSSTEVAFYKLGTVVYSKAGTFPVRLQRLQKSEFFEINKSDLTAPGENFPVYLYENNKLTISPSNIVSEVSASFLRKPKNIKWSYIPGSLGQYIYDNSPNSQNFELNPSEQTEVITRVLLYSGVIIRDPQIVQIAASEIQQNEINQKS
jgi:hypothetical protein